MTWTTVHHIVAVQAKHHIVARSANHDVRAAERLVRDGASLNRHVVFSVVVEPDEKLRSLAVFDERGLRDGHRAHHYAQKRQRQTRR